MTKGAIEEVQNPSSPGFYNHLFLADKKDGGHHPIIDLSIFNTYLEVTKIQDGDKVFHHGLLEPGGVNHIHGPERCLFPYKDSKAIQDISAFYDKVYQFRALPFWIVNCPLVFIKLMGVVAVCAHIQGIRVHVYLDGWLL